MPATILHFASVFSKEECDLVASLFTKQLPELLEERRIPNLPRMPDDYAVFRVSRLDEDGTLLRTGHIDFILQRLLDTLRAPMHDEQIQTRYAMTSQPTNRRHSQQSSSSPIDGVANNGVRDGGGSSSSKLDSRNAAQRQTPDTDQILARDIFPLGSLPASASEFHASVEFTLMHEFRPSFDRFDWHVDTKPNDGKWRTFNVNIMLSAASDYTGGQLQVGGRNISAQQGDLYLYPASAPHAVHTVASGVRRTLVLALADPVYAASARYVRGGGGGGGMRRADNVGSFGSSAAFWRRYWSSTELRFDALAFGPLAAEPKLHLLRGEFLEASGRGDDARGAFCLSYRARPADAANYAQLFLRDGVEALGESETPRPQRLAVARAYLQMADCIEPNREVQEAIAAIVEVEETEGEQSTAPGLDGVLREELRADLAELRADSALTDKI
uniref:Prolyl 4-hydroxylase alpha subunit Fe(2+) 2OG dioxygenase domain-containing protein n=1 Tax=Chrysotila carterae TaxID=13221 RepID=A0A6S9TE07_CHRCT